MILDYWNEVEEAIQKKAGNLNEEIKKDIRQSVYLGLLEATGLNKKRASKLALELVQVYLRKTRKEQREISLTEPSVFRIAENQNSKKPENPNLDIENIKEAVEKLPNMAERLVLELFYGIGYPAQSIPKISKWFGKPVLWVKRKKDSGVKKARKMLNIKEIE